MVCVQQTHRISSRSGWGTSPELSSCNLNTDLWLFSGNGGKKQPKVRFQKEHNVTRVHGNNYKSPKLLQHFPSKVHALGSEEAWAVSKRMKSSPPWGKRERCLWLQCSCLSLHPATPSTRAGSSACSISKINHQPECFWSVSQANHLVTNLHPLSAKLPVLLNATSRS